MLVRLLMLLYCALPIRITKSLAGFSLSSNHGHPIVPAEPGSPRSLNKTRAREYQNLDAALQPVGASTGLIRTFLLIITSLRGANETALQSKKIPH